MAYRYPDKADQITLSLVLLQNTDVSALNAAEDVIFSSCKEIFRRNDYQTLLDLGCGKGRLVLKFSKYFKQVSALEPDETRLEQARKVLEKNNIRNVNYISVPFEESGLPGNSFDVVICNQVVQHIHTDIVEDMMRGVFKVLRDRGSLVLTTTYSNRQEDYYLKSFVENGKIKSNEISRKEFNDLTTNDNDILPIRYFSQKTLHHYLSPFKILKRQIHNDVYPDPMLDTVLFVGKKSRDNSIGYGIRPGY